MENEQMPSLEEDKGNEIKGKSWIQDISNEKAAKMIDDLNTREKSKGGMYKLGESKSGEEGMFGIYYFEPISSKESE
ncbi:MAG: hypothetical protein KAS78_06165 [Candidatus Pacebacteria bacterium]|nr:hypothetical protein [Candidatus Paceibacterota bacterium]